MTSDAKRLINVFLKHLGENDKKEVLEYFKNYKDSDSSKKIILEQKMFSESKVLGPVSGNVCPYCGK
jgi:hypothetical protein